MFYRLMYGADLTWLILIPALIISLIAQTRVSSVFRKYNQVPSRRGIPGFEAARMILNDAGIYDVRIEPVAGSLTDHYSPSERVLRLSQDVYAGTSLAALGVAAHEAGHALQHQEDYFPVRVRTAMVPVVRFAGYGSWIILMAGILFSISPLVKAGIILYALLVLFELVTLPVEYDASSRALAHLSDLGVLDSDEIPGARAVLSAAGWTYVASLLTAAAQLLRLVLLFGGRGRRK